MLEVASLISSLVHAANVAQAICSQACHSNAGMTCAVLYNIYSSYPARVRSCIWVTQTTAWDGTSSALLMLETMLLHA